jgi:hypothetical protein
MYKNTGNAKHINWTIYIKIYSIIINYQYNSIYLIIIHKLLFLFLIMNNIDWILFKYYCMLIFIIPYLIH